MNANESQIYNRAGRLAATCLGFMAGIGGFTHGIGEFLQGNVRPNGIIINSWTQGPIAETMGGEPGMTIVPNLQLTGILCMLAGLALMAWSLAFVTRRRGGLVQILLAVAMLLVGGGFGPPLIGILAGLAGTTIHAPLAWWRKRFSGPLGRGLARLWPLVFGINLLNALFLFIGSTLLVYLFQVDNHDLFLYSFFIAMIGTLLTLLTGLAYDLQPPARRPVPTLRRASLPNG